MLGVVVRAVLGDARSKTWQMLVAGFVVRSAKVPGGGGGRRECEIQNVTNWWEGVLSDRLRDIATEKMKGKGVSVIVL